MKTIHCSLIALTLFLSACGGGSSSSPDPVVPDPVTPDPVAPDPTPSDPPAEPEIRIEGKIVAGLQHTCLLNRGELDCWGRNDAGQADVPQEVENVIDVDAGENFTCAIHSNNQVTCWGDSNDNKLLVPNNIVNPMQLVAGSRHACVLDQNGVICWGNNENQQLELPAIEGQVDKLVAAWDVSCALIDQALNCWGDGDSTRTQIPEGLTAVLDVAISQRAMCAISDNGVECWGSNARGELIVPADLLSPTDITAHLDGFCALQEGVPTCWGGLDAYGELSDAAALSGLTQIDAFGFHICGVSDTAPVCWGANVFGQRIVPGELGELLEISAEGESHFCFLGSQATRCVGLYSDKQEAIGQTQYFGQVEKVLVSDFGHGCTLNGNTLDCFGLIGRASFDEPGPINDAVDFRLGIETVCYLNTQQTILCFGSESQQDQVPFTFLNGQENVSMFDMSWFGACYANDDGVSCDFNDLITNDSIVVAPPEQFFDLRYLGIGFFHACALDGSQPICWGADSVGRTDIPGQISDAQRLVVGAGHNCAVDSQNGLACWGAANDNHDPSVPEGFADASLVDIYLQTTCALVESSVRCWTGTSDQDVIPFKVRVDLINPD